MTIRHSPFVQVFRPAESGYDFLIGLAASTRGRFGTIAIAIKRHPQVHASGSDLPLDTEIIKVFHSMGVGGMRAGLVRSPRPGAIVAHDVHKIILCQGL